jgi:DNA-binding CsgD family transcriptional regulator/tetratricopeptide (TPR) repeat protein
MAPVSRRRTPVLVGRRAELSALEAALAATTDGLGQIVVVDGEAGIGKSRLIEDFIARVDDALCVTGNCVDAATDALAYAPWTELLWWLVREIGADALGPERTELARLLPELGAADNDGSRDLLFEAIVEVLHRCASSRSLIVVIEDLHWIDPASRDVLLYVARNLRRLPLLLVATHRPAPGNNELQELLGHLNRFGASDVSLGALADEDAADIASLLSGEDAAAPEVLSIVDRAEGNPLFVEEFVAAAGDEQLPATIRHLMLSRFNSTAPDGQRLAEVAATIGVRAPRAWLVAASGLSPEAARRAEREVADAGVLVPARDRKSYEFAHSLLREAIVDKLLPSEIVALHADVAEALTDQPVLDDDIDIAAELARHWDAAERPTEALRWTVAAADQADQRYAFETALSLYQRALVWWDSSGEPEVAAGRTYIDLLFATADAAGSAGELELAAALASSAIDDPGSSPIETFGRARVHLWAVRRSQDLQALAKSAVTQLDGVDPEVRAAFLVDLAALQFFDSRPEEALRLGPEIEAALDGLEDPELHARAHSVLASCWELVGRIDRAEEEFEEGARIARRHGLTSVLALVLYNHASILSGNGRRGECFAYLDQVRGLIEEHGLRRFLVAERTLRADETTLSGDLTAASGLLDEIKDVARTGVELETYILSRALVALHAGDYAAAIEALDAAHPDLDDPTTTMSYAVVRADALAAAGDAAAAAAIVDRTLELMEGRLEPYWMASLSTVGVRAYADLAQSTPRGAALDLAAYERAQEIAAAWHKTRERLDGVYPHAEAHTLAVGAELARITDDDAAAAAQEAHEAFLALEEPYLAAHFELREAQALIARRDRRSPTALLVSARRRAMEHGYTGLVQAVEQTARAEQIRLGSRSQETDELLSPREVEVLRLLAGGLSNPEIADSLIIGRRTVRTHVSNILTKLGVSSRAEAVSVAHQRELL